jgi:hypothetical protein
VAQVNDGSMRLRFVCVENEDEDDDDDDNSRGEAVGL